MIMIPTESSSLDGCSRHFRSFGMVVQPIDDHDHDINGEEFGETTNLMWSSATWAEFACTSQVMACQETEEVVGVLTDVSSEETSQIEHDDEDEVLVDSSLSQDTTTSQSTPLKKAVSFGRVEIREYSRVLGDHPMPMEGFPISLGWKYWSTTTVDLHDEPLELSDEEKISRKPQRLSVGERRRLLRTIGGLTEPQLRRAEASRRSRQRQEGIFLHCQEEEQEEKETEKKEEREGRRSFGHLHRQESFCVLEDVTDNSMHWLDHTLIPSTES